jgi:hypothetical protein
MKIEKGKFYRTRGGEKVEVLTTDRHEYRPIVVMFEDGNIEVLYQNGMRWEDKSTSDIDLIAEWTDPVEIPWSDYPTWCNWVAMDFGGEWNGYEFKPKKEKDYWDYHYEGIIIPIHHKFYPKNFTGHWIESLFERPQHQK